MFSVIFEVRPRKERFDEYLELAKRLKPLLETIDGFVDVERFESRRRPGWLLSHSSWRDEKSLIRWRTQGEHHEVQEKGRFEIFSDYRLRVGEATADTDPPKHAPVREQRFDETEVGAKTATLTEILPEEGAAFASRTDLLPAHLGLDLSQPGIVEHDVFASLYNPGRLALLVSWSAPSAEVRWTPKTMAHLEASRHRKIRIVRDYGMFDRRESPQFYPDVKDFAAKRAEPAH